MWHNRRPSLSGGFEPEETDSGQDVKDAASMPALAIPKTLSLPVTQGLIKLILSMDFTCNVDMFLVACKVRHFPSRRLCFFIIYYLLLFNVGIEL